MANQNITLIEDVFKRLNTKKIKYVVLRNWELFFDDLFIEGHNDIDLLCKNSFHKGKLIKTFNAIPIANTFGSKYISFIGGQRIILDIRIVGDGYYCKKWENNMIKNRVFDSRGFFILCNADYKHSLIYHVLIQKKDISVSYLERFKKWELELNKNSLFSILQNYMSVMEYYFSKPFDKFVVQNDEFLNKEHIIFEKTTKNMQLLFSLKCFLKKTKNRIIHPRHQAK